MHATPSDVWRASNENFGALLRALRRDAKLTQHVVAEHLTVSISTVSAWEKGHGAKPPERELVAGYVTRCLGNIAADDTLKKERQAAVDEALTFLIRLREQLDDIQTDGRFTSPRAPLSTLRRDVPSFEGRDEELRLIADAAAQAQHTDTVVAVHAIDGMPGVGKTAFAVHTAHRLTGQFPDGQHYLDLHGHSPGREPVTPRDALASLLTAVGVDPLDLPVETEGRATLWRKSLSGKRMVLVLDNAADHRQIEPLLPGEGRCLVLVTSRRRLTELDAMSIDLPPLPEAEAEAMFRGLAGRTVTEHTALTLLVGLAGRLPLALAILAARFRNRRALTVARLTEELTEASNRLHVIRAQSRAVAAAFDLSYRDLDVEQQRFFRFLGVHPGDSVERLAAAAACGCSPAQAETRLGQLYQEHLVDEFALGRYHLHDLIAEYARALLEDDEEPGARADAWESLLEFYLTATQVAGDLLVRGSRDPDGGETTDETLPSIADDRAAMDWLNAERANLLSTLENTRKPDQVVDFALALAPYLRRTGPWDLTLRVHERAVERARSWGDPEAEARTLLELGKANYHADQYPEAESALGTAGRLFSELGMDVDAAHALSSLGQVWMQTGDHADARRAFTDALTLCEQEGLEEELAGVLVELANLDFFQDEYATSVAANERALAIYDRLGDRLGQAAALKGLAHAWLFSDDYGRARTAAERALELFRATGQVLGEAQTSSVLGSVGRAQGRYSEARADFETAIEIYEQLGDRAGSAMAHIELGVVLCHLGEFPAGERVLRRAMELYETFDEAVGKASVRRELADLLTKAGRLTEARPLLDEADTMFGKLDDRFGKAITSNSYGAWYLAAGEPREARRHYAEALELALEIASPLERAAALAGLARVAKALGEHRAAEEGLRNALAIYESLGAGEAAEIARELEREPGA